MDNLEKVVAELVVEQKWHRWLLIATLAASSWGQVVPKVAPSIPAAAMEWFSRIVG